jgi:hypothetical protein
LGHLLGCTGEDQSFLRHGSCLTGHIKFFVQDFDLHGKFSGLLVKLAEAGDLPSHPLVIKVFDFMLQVHKIAARPEEEGAEPGREWLDRVFFAMPNCVSLHIQIDNVRGLIRALAIVVTSDSAVIQPFDPLGRTVDLVAQRNVEMGHSPIVLNVAIRGSVKHIFVVLDTVVKPSDLLFEVAHLAGLVGLALYDG